MLRKRPLVVLLSSLLLSYAAAFFLSQRTVLCTAVLSLLTAGALFFFKNLQAVSKLIFLPCALALLNFLLFNNVALKPMLRFEGQEIEVQGRIIDKISGRDNDCFTLRAEYIFCEDEVYEPLGDVVFYATKGELSYKVGSRVACFGTAFKNDEDSYSIDYRITDRQFLSIYSAESKLLEEPKVGNIYYLTSIAREKITEIYDGIFPKDVSALINGITLGQTEGIDDRVYRNFKDSGVSHALSVSGMHLAFVTTILWFVLSLFGKNLYIRSLLQILLIWMFTALTGFAPSCCRSAIMLTVFQVGILVQRESDPLTALLFAVMTCCLRNPFAIMNPSLLLSATATLGILVLTDKIAALFPHCRLRLRALGEAYSFIKNTIAMSVAATIGTLPVMILMFRSVSLLAPITNVLIAIVIEILFFIGFFAIVLGWLQPIAACLSWIAEVLYTYCDKVTAAIAGLPFCTASTDSSAFWIALAVVVIVGVALWLFLYKKHSAKLALCYLALFACLIGSSYLADYLARDRIWVDFVDVGQGNTVVVSRNHKAILFDCGGSGLAYQEIQRCFTRRGVREITTIYLTHLDQDHIKYLEPLLSSYSVEKLYLPYRWEYEESDRYIFSLASSRSTIVKKVDEDISIDLSGMQVDILAKHVDFEANSENQRSLVYRLTYGPTEILLTGDVELEAESRLVSEYTEQLKSDVVMIAHHGSDNGTSEDFLWFTDAKVAVISVGKNNVYGLPAPEALHRIEQKIPLIKRTDLDGTVSMKLTQKHYKIEGMK